MDASVRSNSVDFVICIETAHWFGDFTAFLDEVSRVLKPSAYIALADFIDTSQIEEQER